MAQYSSAAKRPKKPSTSSEKLWPTSSKDAYRTEPVTITQTPLWEQLDPHQKDAVEFGVNKLSIGYFCEQGTGKTWITMGLVEQIHKCYEEFEAYFIVPLGNIETGWQDTLNKTLPWLNYTNNWEEYKKLPHPKLFLIHHEGARPPKLINKMKRRKWSLGLIDESQRIKDRGSILSRRMRSLSFYTNCKVILTGTPDDGREYQWWSQFRFFAPFVFGTDWGDFFKKFLKPTGYMGYKEKFKSDGVKNSFLKLAAPHVLVVGREVLGRPAPKFTQVWCTMKGRHRRLYDELEQTMVFEELNIATQFEMTRVMKLHQVAGGYLLDGEYVYEVGKAKLRAADRIVSREDLPIVIFCRFTEEIEALVEHFSKDYAVETIQGHNRKTRTAVQRKFQSGRTDIVIAQIRTGGVAIDLFRSHTCIVYSTTYSRIDFDQAIARLDRRGQEYGGPVRVFFLICKDSIDEVIQLAIIEKRSVSKAATNYINLKRSKLMVKKVPAKAKAKAKAAPKAKAAAKAKAPVEQMKYGVAEIANALSIKAASARVRLRNAGVAKSGKSYGWNSQKDLDAVVKQLKSEDKEAA